ncbi:hypothetical protein RT717_06940 [Imperialibacter roseus]|uniref:Uncharacterized protein n=1 Tax=Imperialibacter roseus TaxID=1324217 RepID=A0ABZ0ITK4_9BACT|nr:hypothetical protein [Imperialibacter roseus]WOK08373.1 hypothetical protein RT717_06940 [Imperialibacter roseus]
MSQKSRSEFAIYYGLGCVLIAFGGIGVSGYLSYQIATDQADFSWGILAMLLAMIATTGSLGYVLIRRGDGG